LIPQSSHIRYRRHWGVSPKTRYQLGECDALVSVIRATPVRPELQARLIDGASEVHQMVLSRFLLEEGVDFWSWP